MASIYTVGQVNNYIKRMFNQDFALNNIYIKGEVSNCKYHTSGHIYFTLKDRTGVISAIMFAGNRSGLKFKMEEGQKVVVLGSVSVYERDGKYQIYAKEIILEGAGLLYQRFEQLKIASATIFSLKAHKSSIEPPPRPTIMVSRFIESRHLIPLTMSFAASAPCTRHGYK